MDLSLHLEARTERETFNNSRISELPDDILTHILSFVTMKEAGRTSLLSKRWRSVWTYIPYLQFDAQLNVYEALDEKLKEETARFRNRVRLTTEEQTLGAEYLEEEGSKYVCWVDQVINSHKAPIVDVFKVEYDLGVNRKDNIDNWLRFAVNKRVKRLELLLSRIGWMGDHLMWYTFPTVSFCNLNFLKMVRVHVSGEVLEKLLRDCLTLEFLSITNSNSLVNLKVVGPSLKIKSLKILECRELKHLEISAPNLEVFHYNGPKLSLNFKSIPKLTELCVTGCYSDYLLSDFHDISSFISQIEVLILESIFQIKRMPEVFPICMRVKLLNITVRPSCDVQLFHLRFLLNACPFLHKFVLRMFNFSQARITKRTKNVEACPHYGLKVLKIEGFKGWNLDTLFVMHLIKSAVSLEKLIIQPATASNKRRAIEKANMLRKNLKPGTTFEFMREEYWWLDLD